MTTKKLTPNVLKKIIMQEVAKFANMQDTSKVASKTEETDADEIADSVEKQIDFMKALKIEESRLSKRLSKIQETKKKVLRKINRTF